jgi:RNA polymerase sigma-70 factor (ECF subfamily)
MSGSRETAEEVTQDVFLAMLTDAHRYVETRGCLESYLIGMARNQVRKQIRTARAASADDFEMSSEQPTTSRAEVVDALCRKQELKDLREAIFKLPPNYREVIVMCDLEGMDYMEAATQLGCSVGTIRSRLHRARSLLEAKLRRKGALGERCTV